jgi:hypothetical protein
LNHRVVERGNNSQSWVKNTNMTDCIYLHVNVLDDICFGVYYSYSNYSMVHKSLAAEKPVIIFIR